MKKQQNGEIQMSEDYLVSRCDGAMMLLSQNIRFQARSLVRAQRAVAEEFRLRVGRAPTVLLPEGEKMLGDAPVTKRDLDMTLELATGASIHSSLEQVRSGYITAKGGYRLGLCGSVAILDGEITGFSIISSIALRISREMKGVANELYAKLVQGGNLQPTLIISPPGGGKTTLLRDMVRLLSDGNMRTALADERGEIAAMSGGTAQMDVGAKTDILDACPKAQAVMMLLRAMNPELIALDEITAPEDIEAITRARNCGVTLLATAHADNVQDLYARPLYRAMMEEKIFENVVVIKRQNKKREYVLERGAGCL